MTSRTVPLHLVDLFEIITSAIVNKRQLILMYGGFRREVCPHSLGWKGDHLSCFAFQFAGGSRQPLPRNGQWRCLHLRSMSEVRIQDGEWHTGPIDPQRSSCVDDFEAYVGFPESRSGFLDDPDLDPVLVEALRPVAASLDMLIVQQIDAAVAPILARLEDLEVELALLRRSSALADEE